MGFRFRRSVKIIPGVRLNFSKSGISTSIGGSGGTINFSKRGTRHTVGIPGSGLSFSSFAPKGSPSSSEYGSGDAKDDTAGGCGCLVLIGLLIAALSQCGDKGEYSPPPIEQSTFSVEGSDDFTRVPPSGKALLYEQNDTIYVTASALNGRSGPSADRPVLTKLPRGQALKVADRSGEWIMVMTTAGAVWIASQHVASSPPPRPQQIYSQPRRTPTRRNNFYQGDCPCSGSRVCIGPRGGRYCITSGGNKRYGV